MNSFSATSPSSQVPMKKKAKVDGITNCATNCLLNLHHSHNSDNQQKCSCLPSVDLRERSSRANHLCQQTASEHIENQMLGGRHSSSTAATPSLKHLHSHNTQRRLNFADSRPFRHGDSDIPSMSEQTYGRLAPDVNAHQTLSAKGSVPHPSFNNKPFLKINSVDANNSADTVGSTSSRNSMRHCQGNLNKPTILNTGMTRGAKQSGMELARGEGTAQRYDRGLEHRAWRSEIGQPPGTGEQSQSGFSEVSSVKKSPPTYRTVLAKRGLVVRDTLGSGSYSRVKHAVYVKPDGQVKQVYPDQVAVKIIDRKSAPKDFQEKFLPRELQMWPGLSHVNIVKMLHTFTEAHRVYMILEYVEGGDALRFIQNKGAVSENTAKSWVHQVTDAVRYLHELQITHRDLKLENMLIDRHNNIKICDFGFVKQCSDNELSKTFCGSKSYAAPEILKGEPYPPKKADVWAIGVILFILVTGRMPFDETRGNTSLLDEHRRLELQWPRGKRSVTSNCKALSVFCLKFLWADRPSIHEVLAHVWFKTSRSAAAVC